MELFAGTLDAVQRKGIDIGLVEFLEYGVLYFSPFAETEIPGLGPCRNGKRYESKNQDISPFLRRIEGLS